MFKKVTIGLFLIGILSTPCYAVDDINWDQQTPDNKCVITAIISSGCYGSGYTSYDKNQTLNDVLSVNYSHNVYDEILIKTCTAMFAYGSDDWASNKPRHKIKENQDFLENYLYEKCTNEKWY